MNNKVRYNSKLFFYSLILFMALIIIGGLFELLNQNKSYRLLYGIITLLVFIIVIIKHRNTQLILKLWSGFFFILPSILINLFLIFFTAGSILQGKEIDALPIKAIPFGLTSLIIGLIIYVGANFYIEENEQQQIEDKLKMI